MIVFLNFPPIEFMGGAEKWMNETAQKINKYEKTLVFSVASQIANLYGKLVLKRTFEKRTIKKLHNHTSLDIASFIPFTSKWRSTRISFKDARLVYIKYEILEVLIVLYFGGLSALRKTVAGIHSPYLYHSPEDFFSILHNRIYSSDLNSRILSLTNKIHVLNKKDRLLMSKKLHSRKIVFVPNGINPPGKEKPGPTNKNILKILSVGELSKRKGTDVLIKIINKSPSHFVFTVVGNGPMRREIELIQKKHPNVTYKGFIDPANMNRLYKYNDLLLLPSLAETMSLVRLEAISHGLTILNSRETLLELDSQIEHTCDNKNINTYMETLEKIFLAKRNQKLKKEYIKNYFQKNFSSKIIDPQLFKNVFGLNI